MFAAAIRETSSRLAGKYGQETAFQVWVEYVKKEPEKTQTVVSLLRPDMTLAQALDILDETNNSIEQLIRNRFILPPPFRSGYP